MHLPDAETLFRQFADQVAATLQPNSALVGIHSGGVWLVDRLLPMLQKKGVDMPEVGMLDISFYRDDFNKRGLHADTKASQVPFEVQDKHIVLVDDVFHTGRTIRAAMNELFDYGRPASISLAVLVDRGGREMPIAPQLTAAHIPLAKEKNLQLLRREDGSFYFELKDMA